MLTALYIFAEMYDPEEACDEEKDSATEDNETVQTKQEPADDDETAAASNPDPVVVKEEKVEEEADAEAQATTRARRGAVKNNAGPKNKKGKK